MNTKLRKPRPSESSTMSRTMQLAIKNDSLQRGGSWSSAPLAAVPQTKAEQYWATRALVAETLLSASGQHQVELAKMRRIEEEKRERELGAILHASDRRQRRLELVMVVSLAVLLGFVSWLVMMITPGDRDAKRRLNKPSHFTIPILSPFASVVEHQTGVFSTQAATILVIIMGFAMYAALKHRLSQWRTR